MKKAKIYIPSKTAMQSGRGKSKKWVLTYESEQNFTNQLMGWESSTDTLQEIKIEFDTKEQAIDYAKANKISYEIQKPKKRKLII
ncbi:MAG: hypothetical protein CL687_02220, partial [Candidatus Pelagibacter sp.]|nr:hypothetical protein [Candidatus Pelagibacter sp.]